MEALKKAEQAKQGQAGEAAPGGDIKLEPIVPAAPAAANGAAAPIGKTLPELPSQLEVLDDEFIAHARQPAPADKPRPPSRPVEAPRAAAPHAAEHERAAAHNVFAAKKPEPSRKPFAVTMIALTLVGAAAIGGYFWWQLQPRSGLGPAGSLGRIPPAAPATSAAPVLPAATASRTAPPTRDEQDEEEARSAAVPPAPTPARAAPPAPESPIRITTAKLKLNPALAQAFEALNAGNLAAARADYERVLKGEPKNADALHGMAAIALREGNPGFAEEYYAKALEADPKDALALAGLVGLKERGGQGDPLAAESRLKSLIAAQPEVAALHFALGNVYARQSRWGEAQQAYFKAYSAEPEHPDYLFNLAISLDHLRQPRLAAQYYGQALAAAESRPAGFDKAQAAARLREIKP